MSILELHLGNSAVAIENSLKTPAKDVKTISKRIFKLLLRLHKILELLAGYFV